MEGLWVIDPDSKEEIFLSYEELEDDTRQSLIKPIGGFVFKLNDIIAFEGMVKTPFYIQDWLPHNGKMMIYAPAKSGKSYLAVQMARCIASGEDFLGMRTSPGRVLYLQFELGESTLRERLQSTKQSYEDVYGGTKFNLKIDTEAGHKMTVEAIEAVKPKVLIIDPLYKAMLSDENEATEVRKALDFLDFLIDEYGCSVVLLHHAGKDINKRARGSSILEDWVDSYIRMKQVNKKGEPLRVQFQPEFLRHAAIPEQPIEAELNPCFEFEVVGGELTTKELIYLEMANASPNSVSPGILLTMDIGTSTAIYRALSALVEEGKIKKVGRGEYIQS